MRLLNLFVLSLAFALSGCTIIQRTAHMYGNDAPQPLSFQYKDGGLSTYYSFVVGDGLQSDTVVFFYGGTGCPSWKSVMPSYVSGLTLNARVFVLNKRYVPDRSTGLFDCGREFHRLFATKAVTPELLNSSLNEIGSLQAKVRAAHLEAHLTQVEILTPEQNARYPKLRGYGSTGAKTNHGGQHKH